MCGIVGIVGRGDVAPLLVDALKRLEYRGYDSAGVATVDRGRLDRRRAEGKLVGLERRLKEEPLSGAIGIGHTRWATHGAPTENNAHPHFAGSVGVVHNGIIENFASLKAELMAEGVEFRTQTDTEVVAQLLAHLLDQGHDPKSAMLAALQRLEGAYALAVLFAGHDGMIIGARNGPPLAVGYGDGEMYLGSDAIALAPFTNDIAYLEDGDWTVVTRAGGGVLRSRRQAGGAGAAQVGRHDVPRRQGQPPAFHGKGDLRAARGDLAHHEPVSRLRQRHGAGGRPRDRFRRHRQPRRRCLRHGLYCRAGRQVHVRALRAAAGRHRYRLGIPLPRDAAFAEIGRHVRVAIGRDGRYARIAAILQGKRPRGSAPWSMCRNRRLRARPTSCFRRLPGPEIGVASTKAFTCQLAVLASLAIGAAKARGIIGAADERAAVQVLQELPRLMTQVLSSCQPQIETLARDLSKFHHVLYLGRGTNFPLAMEGALKLKEISYIHAEGYAAGELKHGPIALIDETMPVIVIAPSDRVFDKTVSNMQEVAARGGRIILITDEKGAAAASIETMSTIVLPHVDELIAPMVYALPIQLLAYHTAVFMGTDVDQPRNLAKSVTVE